MDQSSPASYLITEVVKELLIEGHKMSSDARQCFRWHLTEHINRLGDSNLNLKRVLEPDYSFGLPQFHVVHKSGSSAASVEDNFTSSCSRS